VFKRKYLRMYPDLNVPSPRKLKKSKFILQSTKLIINLMSIVFILLSLFFGTPVKTLYGETICSILSGLISCLYMKQILGGFFIAIYRIICLKRRMNVLNQRTLRNQLQSLEITTMGLFLVLFGFVATYSGTEPSIEFFR
jgi:hypothetical protein